MKKRISMLLAFMAMLVNIYAQKQVYEYDFAAKRNATGFHGIETSAGIKVKITKSNAEEIAVTANEEELIGKIKTEVKEGILHIHKEDNSWKFWNNLKNWHVTVYVSYKMLDQLKASSGAQIEGENLIFTNLNVQTSSGAIIKLSGNAALVEAKASSGSQFKGFDLNTINADADVSSGAMIQVNVAKELKAEASSGGSVQYKGECVIKDIKTGSGGSIRKKA